MRYVMEILGTDGETEDRAEFSTLDDAARTWRRLITRGLEPGYTVDVYEGNRLVPTAELLESKFVGRSIDAYVYRF